ncbi:type II toxin-antitoxin system HigB family toxin [Pseudomonas sp. CFBP 8771]|uniref:Type II toxin-antitoxin system HigB family toxin n=1 Tax=Pseudomonas baltica TaxID=2762576 RepID=A0A7X1G3S3_9PSED|nr:MULTISPECIES: type II toxin-antitoxin system HigB family toxin [Pseudomonas]MBC2677666.1 type II toxin-antitoxin system HigB family toxin [Pseudomonas baltica]MBD8601383.1 type II toxin-antitoxin system HigB family toxin [Pseudomonas sp. CFBP 8771]
MDVLKKDRFDDACRRHPTCATALKACYRILCALEPSCYNDLADLFGSRLDLFKPRAQVGWVVIAIGGNKLRLIAGVNYKRQKLYVKHIYTHAEYDAANDWYARNNQGAKP